MRCHQTKKPNQEQPCSQLSRLLKSVANLNPYFLEKCLFDKMLWSCVLTFLSYVLNLNLSHSLMNRVIPFQIWLSFIYFSFFFSYHFQFTLSFSLSFNSLLISSFFTCILILSFVLPFFSLCPYIFLFLSVFLSFSVMSTFKRRCFCEISFIFAILAATFFPYLYILIKSIHEIISNSFTL